MTEKQRLVEQLFDLQIPGGVRLSPNAQQVIWTTTLHGEHKVGEHVQSTIWIADTGIAKSARQLTSGLFNDKDAEWCPDGKSIAFVSDRAKPSECEAIYILPIGSPGEAYPITPTDNEQSIDGYEWSPDGKSIAYMSADEKTAEKKAKIKDKDDANVWGEDWEYQRLRLVHVATKKTTTLVSRDSHVADFAWNDDGSKIAFVHHDTPYEENMFLDGARFATVDAWSKQIDEVYDFPAACYGMVWAGNSIYFIGPADGKALLSAFMVYSIDLNASPRTCVKHAYGEINDADSIRKVGKDVTVYVLEGLQNQIRMLGGRTLLDTRKFILSWNAAFTHDSDEIILAVALDDVNSAGEVFSVTASGGAMVQLSSHGDEDQKFGTAMAISCESKSIKGEAPVRLDGMFITPESCKLVDGKPEKPLPTVLIIHGGPYGRNCEQFDASHYKWQPLLLAQGYAVLTTNYRGSSGRGEAFAGYSLGGMGLYDYADVIELVNQAIKEGYADKNRLISCGWSQGGYLSYLASVRNGLHGYGWQFKATIPGAGVTNWETMALTSDLGRIQRQFTNSAPWSEDDKSNVSNRNGSALWEFAGAAKKKIIPPMLILHGELDERVPIEQARGFRRALTEAKLPFEYVTYPREGHGFTERKHDVDMADRVVRFVDTHIGS